MINARDLPAGARVALSDGSILEIVSNPKDGIWVFARYLSAPGDAALVGTEDMIFAADIVQTREGA
jgi:hypothetical protein